MHCIVLSSCNTAEKGVIKAVARRMSVYDYACKYKIYTKLIILYLLALNYYTRQIIRISAKLKAQFPPGHFNQAFSVNP